MDSHASSSKKRNRESWVETSKLAGKRQDFTQPAPLIADQATLPFHPGPEDYINALPILTIHIHPQELLDQTGYITNVPTPPNLEYARSQERCSARTCNRKRSTNESENTQICAGAADPNSTGHKYCGYLHLLEPLASFAATPHSSAFSNKSCRRAVVIKTGLVYSWYEDDLIIQIIVLSAVDFVTGE